MRPITPFKSHGDGSFTSADFKSKGGHLVIEKGVLIFHPSRISFGNNVYIGHNTILKAYHRNEMIIGDNVWIGQSCFLHSAGGIRIGDNVGIGPRVSILTSAHREEGRGVPILFSDIATAPVCIENDADIGIGAVILPGVTIGRGAQIGAGAVVTEDIPAYAVAAGSPARLLRLRSESPPVRS
jgi:acetyltransferase-like isoleucine patch superfamily enzyme